MASPVTERRPGWAAVWRRRRPRLKKS
jgi:hypothetical protein